MNANAASVHPELGNVKLGLLTLMVTSPVYLTLAGVAFVPPKHPLQVVIIPGLTEPQIAALQISHIRKKTNGNST